MQAKENILETERLSQRELVLTDSPFILKLLNTPTWLEYIGDRNVHSLEDAENYLLSGPIRSYKDSGYGLLLVSLKEDNLPIGICGLLKRDYLDHIDIGFALMPKFEGQGFGFEMAQATMLYSKQVLGIDKVVAITSANNKASVKILNKIGLNFEAEVEVPDSDPVHLYS